MKIAASSVLSLVAMIAVLPDILMGNPRAQTIQLTCGQQLQNNATVFASNFVVNMQNISDQIMIQGWGVSSVGSGPDSNYGLAQCHDDLSLLECVSCYARVRTGLDQCYPSNGGRIFLDGCFLRVENYSFFQEYRGSSDHAVCGNRTGKDSAFQESARRAVLQAAQKAPNSNGYARAELPNIGASNPSAYVLATCWKTLNANSCRVCLEKASSSILGCLPWSEGRALNTGCFMRYSDTNFLNPSTQNSPSSVTLAGNSSTALLDLKCGNVVGQNTPTFLPNYMSTLQDMALQLNQSGFAVAVTGSGPDSPNDAFSLAQCYSSVSSSDCLLCYSEARTMLPVCFKKTMEIFLGGCFFRVDYYNFFYEYSRAEDKVVCANNGTRKNMVFRHAAAKGLSDAIKNNGYTLVQLPASDTPMETAYVLSNCWNSLSSESCTACLKNASASLTSCLPSAEGFALNTGCIVRYADTDFLNTKLENRSSRDQKNGSSKGNKLIIVVAVVCLVVSVSGAVVIGGHMRKRRKLQKKREASNLASANDEKFATALRDGGLECKYSTLKKATGSFHDANRLGQGGFGTVYKGILPDGREIAVKRLFFNNHHRAADFYNEVNIISSIRHKNLVRLLGCSCSGPESLLVYELLPNGSLDHFIFGPSKGKVLNWEKRLNIIMGTAEGLVYLHENTETRIVHRDIKASNILLDSKLNAKIADFGLARSFEEDKSHISTAIAGTLGYMAPEYISHGQLTEKADVYSFGVLLLEIITGRKNHRNNTSEYSDNLVTTVWKHFQHGRMQELFDANLMLNANHELSIEHKMLRVVHVGLLCTQKMPSVRPSMSTALQMLSRKEEQLPSPTPPPYVDGDELTTGLGDIQNKPCYTPKSGDSTSNASLPYSSFYPR